MEKAGNRPAETANAAPSRYGTGTVPTFKCPVGESKDGGSKDADSKAGEPEAGATAAPAVCFAKLAQIVSLGHRDTGGCRCFPGRFLCCKKNTSRRIFNDHRLIATRWPRRRWFECTSPTPNSRCGRQWPG